MHTYAAFGLLIDSALPCPELREASGPADITIRYGELPRSLDAARTEAGYYQARPGALLFAIDDVARFLVCDGREIVIERALGAADEDVRLFLLGTAFGALLHQRDTLALHASAIAVSGRCVAFLGDRGAGKSTLAAAFQRKGAQILTDDVCAVQFDPEGRPSVVPGYPQAKLWADALRRLEMEPESLRRVRAHEDKRVLPTHASFSEAPRPLTRLYILEPADTSDISLTPLTGPDKFTALQTHTYRPQFLEGLDVRVPHFRAATRLAAQLPMVRVVRPVQEFMLDELVALVQQDLEE